jgi:hypothetical protein
MKKKLCSQKLAIVVRATMVRHRTPVLNEDEARRIAANIAKLQQLFGKT